MKFVFVDYLLAQKRSTFVNNLHCTYIQKIFVFSTFKNPDSIIILVLICYHQDCNNKNELNNKNSVWY